MDALRERTDTAMVAPPTTQTQAIEAIEAKVATVNLPVPVPAKEVLDEMIVVLDDLRSGGTVSSSSSGLRALASCALGSTLVVQTSVLLSKPSYVFALCTSRIAEAHRK